MKYINFTVSLLFFILMGCSLTYKLKDFGSEEMFYDDFNNYCESKGVKVILSSDSTFSASEGAMIKNDALISSNQLFEKKSRQFSLSDIEEINFAMNDNQTAKILLKNGEKINAENIRTVHDSVYFAMIERRIITNTTPLDKVKSVSYTNNLKGLYDGIKIGTVAGGVVGFLFGKSTTDYHGETQEISGFLQGTIIGILIGGVTGYCIGYPITYEFTP